jgi:hypothetical protein
MNARSTPEIEVDGIPARVNAALDRLRAEQRRACQLLADGSKCQRLSALYEQEARLWTLLAQHTAEPVYCRAAIEAECTARVRAREYANLARYWNAHPDRADRPVPRGAS